jgi:hypothetical protein
MERLRVSATLSDDDGHEQTTVSVTTADVELELGKEIALNLDVLARANQSSYTPPSA